MGKGKLENNESSKEKEKFRRYMRLWLDLETIDIIYDITYTNKVSSDMSYRLGDAVSEAMVLLRDKTENIVKAPDNFKKISK